MTRKVYRIAKRNGRWGIYLINFDGRPKPRPVTTFRTYEGCMHAACVYLASMAARRS